MDQKHLIEQLSAAEDRLVESEAHLSDLQADALMGTQHDAVQHDEIVRLHREAKREAEAARLAWVRWQRLQQTTPTGAISPRLLFVRWLYHHGYISG